MTRPMIIITPTTMMIALLFMITNTMLMLSPTMIRTVTTPDSYNEYKDFTYGDDDDDNNDDDSYASSSSEEGYDNNVLTDMYGNQYTINNDGVVPHDDTPMTIIQAAQRQLNAILARCNTTSTIKAFTNRARQEYDAFSLPNKNTDQTLPATPSLVPAYAKNDDHDSYLYHRWNKSNRNKTSTIKPTTTPHITTTTYQTAYVPIDIPVKDDPSVTPTLKTLCTLDTCSSDSTY